MFYFDERRRVALTANNSETIALLNYAIGKSIALPDEQTINALDAFYGTAGVAQLIADKLDLYYHFQGSGLAAFKLLNAAKKNNSWDGTGFGGLTWSGAGATGNGSNAYIDTGFQPSLLVTGQKYLLNNAARAATVYATNSGTGLGAVIDGAAQTSNTMFAENNNGHKVNQGTANASLSVDMSGTGLKAVSRSGTNNTNVVNKSVQTASTAVSTGLDAATQTILSRRGANDTMGYSVLTLSNYFMGAALTFSETQLIRTATNAQLAALGLSQIA